jgi:pyruvate,water dikinase
VVDLADDAATTIGITGAKASKLAVAAAAGLPVLGGVVLTERLCDALATPRRGSRPGRLDDELAAALAAAWNAVGGAVHALVVRSSSRAEDGTVSSLAGQFTSVLDVGTFDDFVAAVDEVIRSAQIVALDDGETYRAPMAVLVQPQLDAVCGGVMFGLDPVSGRADRLVVAAVAGGPERLVSGTESGTTHVLTRRGRLVEREGEGMPLGWTRRRRLAALARQVAEVFGGPQDVEWAVDGRGDLWLLQSRPITAAATVATAPRRARVLGPGPVAETFPDPLSPLEQDLWLRPLNDGLTHALVLAGLGSPRRLRAVPPVVAIAGRAAVDLDAVGASPARRSLLARLDPIPPARRLVAAWRTGRLRAAVPALAADVIARADAELASVRAPASLPIHQLLAVLDGSGQALASLHGYEVLIGLLATGRLDGAEAAAGRALRALAEGRAAGRTDAEIVAAAPVVLSLVAPAIRPRSALPSVVTSSPTVHVRARNELTELREELRLRARWLHELTAVVAWEVGARLHAAGALPAAGAVRWLRIEELRAAVDGAGVPSDLHHRRDTAAPPLPTAFRIGAAGGLIPVDISARAADRGQGAGGGRVVGTVHPATGVPPAGAVLVVSTLDPALASVLPHLGGLVAETGSVLSHLAILAREFGVPTVVGVAGAVTRFPPGTPIVIDGTTGEVRAG